MKEIWRDIPGYEGLYQASNLLRVRSLNYKRTGQVRVLTTGQTKDGYSHLKLRNKGRDVSYGIHEIVYMTFVDNTHDPKSSKLIVEHKIPLSAGGTNEPSNLQLMTQRDNVLKSRKAISQYPGVSWYSAGKKWRSFIHDGGKRLYLGQFNNEIDAYNAYKKEYDRING